MPTQWKLQASAVYDALCLLNIWTGDPFYTQVNPGILEQWEPRLTPDVKTAFGRLAKAIREEGQGIISAQLCLHFSALKPKTLEDLIRAIDQPLTLRETFQQTPYFDLKDWGSFEGSFEDLRVVLKFLQAQRFEDEYHTLVAPRLESVLAHWREQLAPLDVVGAVERELNQPVSDAQIDVFVLEYTKPHGIKLVGNQFVTAASWPVSTTARVAIHELMHPPYDFRLSEVQNVVHQLREDKFLFEHFQKHDPSFGYNTWEGFIEENCVRALEQCIAERFGIAKNARERFSSEDGGMHVLAAVLHPLLKTHDPQQTTFAEFLAFEVTKGRLRPGTIEVAYTTLMST
jgi:hypothetical protein